MSDKGSTPTDRATTPRTNPPGRIRITVLDWLRGIMLACSVALNSVVVMPEWLGHAAWDGVHPEDVIFPIFVTLSGCGLAFALRSRTDWLRWFRRIVVLTVAGLAYNWLIEPPDSWETLRFTGVLQLYAAVVLAVVLGHQLTRSWRGWALWTAFYALIHSALLVWWGTRCTDGGVSLECNPSGPLDTSVFGTHALGGGSFGHDPEGLVSILGAMVSVSAGATIGHLLLDLRKKSDRAHLPLFVTRFVLLGVALMAVGWLIAAAGGLPPIKRVWSASFALPIAGMVAIALALGHVAATLWRSRPTVRPVVFSWLEALGRNSLLIYFGSHVASALLRRIPGEYGEGALYIAYDALGGGMFAQALITGAALAFWIALAVVLNRYKIYIRA